ncbi:hypothetical protein, partial [Agrilactobacillus composti]|uniref:hypothetical protein n=1 Tax=Agrilactobacillus composti TaxID=398555 RepID=UPI0005524E1A
MKTSKVKYLGVAAAALLAVAPVATTAFTATSAEQGTVQAATTTLPDTTSTIQWDATGANGGAAAAKIFTMNASTNQLVQATTANGNLIAVGPVAYNQETVGGIQYYTVAGVNGQKYYVAVSDATANKLVTGFTKTADLPNYTLKNNGAAITDAAIAGKVYSNDANGAATSNTAVEKDVVAAINNGTITGPIASYILSNGVNAYGFVYNGAVYFIDKDVANLAIVQGPTTPTYLVNAVNGTVTTKRDLTPLYRYAITTDGTGQVTTDGNADATGTYVNDYKTTLTYDQVAGSYDNNGKFVVLAYHVVKGDASGKASDLWVKAGDVNATTQYNYAENVKGTVTATADSDVYGDIAFSNKIDSLKVGKGQNFDYTQVIKDSLNGDIVGYARKQGKTWTYVKAANFKEVTPEVQVDTEKLPTGTAVYSDNKAATIYSDAATTKDSGTKLNTSYDEWSAFDVSKDSDGHIVAYRLGKDQWVKASDLATEKSLSGTFDTGAGVALYNADGTLTGTIQADGQYTVFGVKYIDGKQSLKLGTDAQWVHASDGDYYPA